MRRFVVYAAILAAWSLPTAAQYAPKAEVFGGFSYLNYEALSVNLANGSVTENCSSSSSSMFCTEGPTPTVNFTPRMSLYGLNGSVTADLTPWFGFTTDVSGNYGNGSDSITATLTTTNTPCTSGCTTTETIQDTVSDPRVYTFLFGPQFTFPAGKTKVYGRFLAGGMNKKITLNEAVTLDGTPALVSPLASTANSANYFAMAIGGGVDYPIRKKMSWRVGADYLTSTGTAQNHVRVLTGVVWTLGK
jgi:hypothetical protein